MINIGVQLALWDSAVYQAVKMRGGELINSDQFRVGEHVIIKTSIGTDLGNIIKIEQISDNEITQDIKTNFILRKASNNDVEKFKQKNKEKKKIIKKCEDLAKKRKLQIKIIDVLFAFDGGKITFAFVSASRIDFRELVKDLVKEFHKSIRMYQVGARQEAKLSGDTGSCGRGLCCNGFLNKLGNVTIEMMLDQQLSHRGAERLTGVCGRLKCCLAYEQEAYSELIKKMPPIGSVIKTKQGKGKVVDWRILKQSVILEKEDPKEGDSKTEVLLTDIKT